MDSHKTLGGALLLTLGGLAATGAVLGAGGQFSALLDLFSHFAVLYAVASAFVAVHAAILPVRFRRAALGLAVLGLAASTLMLAPEFLRSTGPQAPAGATGTIKVIQINALRTNTEIRRVADWLGDQRPDVVIITETRHDLRDMLQARFGWKTAGGHGALVIFTPRQFLKMDRPEIPRSSRLTFINATYAQAAGQMELVAGHLYWPNHPAVPRQIAALETVIGQRPRERMIFTGDLNATPWSAELRRLDRSLGLSRRDRAVATFPAQVFGRPWPLPFLAIDHVYAGPGWATVRVERGPWLGSDHYPLIVTLAPVS